MQWAEAATACGRRALAAAALAFAAAGAPAATGQPVAELSSYDSEIEAFMARWAVPGAAVAVAREGRLVFARGYGTADPASGAAVQPDAGFRIASISKPITAAAVMQLVEQGVLDLDLAVFPYLGRGQPVDARLNHITVRHLLEHSGGWDRDAAGDPMFQPTQIAQALGIVSPPDADAILRWMLTQPLQFDPGSRYAYSNFGYLVLGEVVAKASGQRYEDFVRTLLLGAGITRTRLGASLPPGRLDGEVTYQMPAGTAPVRSVFAGISALVPWPYGGFAIEPMAAHGGWVASAVDLVAFAAAAAPAPRRPALLQGTTVAEMTRRPAFVSPAAAGWYAKGWSVNASGNLWHGGSLPGTTTLLVAAANGTQWAVVMNQRSESQLQAMSLDLDNTLWRAYNAVRSWPAGDQFAALGNPGPIAGCYGRAAYGNGVLCLPVVEVPGEGGAVGRFTATLRLTDAATLTFTLESASAALGSAANPARFDPAAGTLTLEEVVLPAAGGVPARLRVVLELLPQPAALRFRVRSAVAL